MTTTLIHMAREVATTAHEGQMGKEGTPYILHPIAVADSLALLYPDDEELIAGGYLHDVLEDTTASIDAFPSRTIAMVKLVTKPVTPISYDDFIQHIIDSRNVDAIRLKLADIRHNLSRPLPEGWTSKPKKYYRALKTLTESLKTLAPHFYDVESDTTLRVVVFPQGE